MTDIFYARIVTLRAIYTVGMAHLKIRTERGCKDVRTVNSATGSSRLRDVQTLKAVLRICTFATPLTSRYSYRYYTNGPIHVAVLSKASVLSRLIAGIPGSNPAEGMHILLMCLLCVV